MPPPKVIFLDLKLCCLFCGGRLKVRGVRKFTVMNTRSKLREKLDQWTVFWRVFFTGNCLAVGPHFHRFTQL